LANSRSAKKRARTNLKRGMRNKAIRSQYRTYITKAEKLIGTGELSEAEEAVKQAISVLDKTARRKVLHANNVARRKSRLMKKLNAVRTAS